MKFISAQNSCYYKCDTIRKIGVKEPNKYKTIEDIKNKMRSQIHADIEIKRKIDRTGATKALERQKIKIEEQKKVEPLIEGIKQAINPQTQPPKMEQGNGSKIYEGGEKSDVKETNEMMKNIMKNNSKNIINKIMNKEKNKNKRMGKGCCVKGSGVKEI